MSELFSGGGLIWIALGVVLALAVIFRSNFRPPRRIGGGEKVSSKTLSGSARGEIQDLIAANKLIPAIKVYREETGAGLKDAKEAVEAMRDGRLMGDTSRPASAGDGVEAALARGHLIEAIKIYREVHGVGLKEAKEAVEAMRDGRPVPRAPLPLIGGVPDILEMIDDDVRYQVQDALSRGRKIEAIKLVRAATGLGLKEAKDGVEAMDAQDDG